MTISQRERFIPFSIGIVPYYVDKVTGNRLTVDEFERIVKSNYESDKQRGYKDRVSGYYDKWYRYNRLDDGAAYDEGQRMAIKDKGDELPEMIIIPCTN